MQIFGQNVSQLPLPAQGDQPQGRQPKLDIVASPGLAQGGMKELDIIEDLALQQLGEQVVEFDNAAQAMDRLTIQQGVEDGALFLRIAKSKGRDEHVVGRLIFGLNQRME